MDVTCRVNLGNTVGRREGREAASNMHEFSSTKARHDVLKKDFYNVVL